MSETARGDPTPVVSSGAKDDPSPRSLETLYREVRQLEDKILLRFETVATKFQGYDEAVKILQEFTNRQPTTEAVDRDLKAEVNLTFERFKSVSAELKNAEKLTCEKFKGVSESKLALDVRYDQLDGSNKEAISAALRAAEKAVEKTELNFTKQIDGLNILINSNKGGLEGTINDLKDRVTTMEASKQGGQDSFKTMISVVGAVVALATIGNIVLALIR